MLAKFKLLIAAWIVELRIVKWAHRAEGERCTREIYMIFDSLDEYEAICARERNGALAKKQG